MQSKQLTDEQIVSLIDFVSNVLEISKSCSCLNLTRVSGAKISCFYRFRAGIYQFLTTDLFGLRNR